MARTIAIGAGVAVVALLGATYVVSQRGAHDCDSAAVAGGAIGGPFELISETGETVTEADVIQEPALIYFGYTFCPDFCPLDAARNAAATDLLAEQGLSVTPVFITVDPARDTVEVMAEYTENFHPKMIGLTGSDEQVAAASAAYRTYYQKADDDPDYYLVAHSTFTYLVMPDAGFVDFFSQSDSPEDVATKAACFIRNA
ncbi:SCO family protein [Yoonia sp. SS1-5]|uniref:SCO family protein n=1 Tax=Yoonia rhodophyticola TaxID=3137370 RepID=A0AAN0MBJ4_9RHOB